MNAQPGSFVIQTNAYVEFKVLMKVVCDNQRQTSAVLDCHCVTYDKESQSTYAGLCFYNCENNLIMKKG